jgi:adenine-specific DNA-methyltransferase
MRYIGSKSSTVESIFGIATKHITTGTFCDPFGGTSTVGAYFKEKGFEVYTGDVLLFAHYFQISKLEFNSTPTFDQLRERLSLPDDVEKYLNQLPLSETGWFLENFASKRGFFTLNNAKIIEACWRKIIEWSSDDLISYNEKAFLLASLINSMDRVANTAGTYYAYLKNFNRKSSRDFVFEFIKPIDGNKAGLSYLGDAVDLIKQRHYDVIYLDPPYNDRRYHGYYHLPELIARCEKPILNGKSGVNKYQPALQSNFYGASFACIALENILSEARFKKLLFHYRHDGIIPSEKINELFRLYNYDQCYEVSSLAYTTKGEKKRSAPTQIYTIYNA